MTKPVAEILEKARREGWATSSIDAMTHHDQTPESGGTSEGCGPAAEGSGRTRLFPTITGDLTVMADQNCEQCHGTGRREPRASELGRSGGDSVPCGC